MNITKQMVESQKKYYFLVLLLWPAYLFVLPYIFNINIIFALIFMIFPGIYIFTWAGYLMHESWHKYVHSIPNRILFHIYSWMLLADPQLYGMLHGIHHSKVNSYEDLEFHPLGEIKNKPLKRVYNILEIIFGIAFLQVVASIVIPKHSFYKSKFSRKSQIASIIIWIVFYGGLGYLTSIYFSIGIVKVVLAYAITIWINSFVLHQSQLIEHGNLIVSGDYKFRNIQTRNLRGDTFIEKIILFLTHGDSKEHVVHHTNPSVYNRPFPGNVTLPDPVVYIKLDEYLKVLKSMIMGETKIVIDPKISSPLDKK